MAVLEEFSNGGGVKLTPAEKKRRRVRQERWRKAEKKRADWTPEQFEEERQRLDREKEALLARRDAA